MVNRTEVAAQIAEVKADPTWSTLEVDLKAKVRTWLEAVDEPEDSIIKILDDLRSY